MAGRKLAEYPLVWTTLNVNGRTVKQPLLTGVVTELGSSFEVDEAKGIIRVYGAQELHNALSVAGFVASKVPEVVDG